MDKKNLYFYYILSKCKRESIARTLPSPLGTKAKLIESYETSGCKSNSPVSNTREIITILDGFVNRDDYFKHYSLDEDARRVLIRCRQRIRNISTKLTKTGEYCFADIFDAIADCLWILASVTLFKSKDMDDEVHLIDRPSQELQMIKKYIEYLYKKINDAKYDLRDMLAAKDTFVWKKVFTGLIEDDNVRYYADPNNFDYSDLKTRIADCEQCFPDPGQLPGRDRGFRERRRGKMAAAGRRPESINGQEDDYTHCAGCAGNRKPYLLFPDGP